MKLLFDENLSYIHAQELRAEGHDALAVVDVGLGGSADDQVRQFAIDDGRVLVTLDADFANVLRFPPEQTPGVIRLRLYPPTEESIRRAIRRALMVLRNMDARGRLVVVDANRIRIRQ